MYLVVNILFLFTSLFESVILFIKYFKIAFIFIGDAGSVFVKVFPDANDDSNFKYVWFAEGSQGKAWSAKSAPIGKRPAGFKVFFK